MNNKEQRRVTSYIRGLKCSVCGTKLLSLYARDVTKFFSVEGWYYCENCNKVFKIDEEDKQKAFNR